MSTPLLHPLRCFIHYVWASLYTVHRVPSVLLTHDVEYLQTFGPPIEVSPPRGLDP